MEDQREVAIGATSVANEKIISNGNIALAFGKVQSSSESSPRLTPRNSEQIARKNQFGSDFAEAPVEGTSWWSMAVPIEEKSNGNEGELADVSEIDSLKANNNNAGEVLPKQDFDPVKNHASGRQDLFNREGESGRSGGNGVTREKITEAEQLGARNKIEAETIIGERVKNSESTQAISGLRISNIGNEVEITLDAQSLGEVVDSDKPNYPLMKVMNQADTGSSNDWLGYTEGYYPVGVEAGGREYAATGMDRPVMLSQVAGSRVKPIREGLSARSPHQSSKMASKSTEAPRIRQSQSLLPTVAEKKLKIIVPDGKSPRRSSSSAIQGHAVDPGGWGREDRETDANGETNSACSTPRRLKKSRSQRAVSLPQALRDHVTILSCQRDTGGGLAFAYLLGTSHISKESCKDVRHLIRAARPQVVFVEVCPDRIAMLMPPEELQVPTFAEIVEVWRNKHNNAFAVLYGWLLAKMAHKMDVFPGAEFRVAYEEAVACGAAVKLGDRPVQVTLRRAWSSLGTWQRVRLVTSLLWQALWTPPAHELPRLKEELKNSDVLTLAVQDMARVFPCLMSTLVTERDLYMAAMLRHVTERSGSVVAVVGKGHQQGIAEHWDDSSIDVRGLLMLPPQRLPWISPSMRGWLLLAATVGSCALIVAVRSRKNHP